MSTRNCSSSLSPLFFTANNSLRSAVASCTHTMREGVGWGGRGVWGREGEAEGERRLEEVRRGGGKGGWRIPSIRASRCFICQRSP